MKHIKQFNINFNDWNEIDNDPDEFTGYKEFHQFLINNDILVEYINNFNNSYIWRSDINTDDSKNLNEFLNNWSSYDFIVKAFLWKKTKEGHKYWLSMDRKWTKLVNSKSF